MDIAVRLVEITAQARAGGHMILTDGIHLVSIDLDELHRFAAAIGLNRSWFQNSAGKIPHYDLMGRMRRRAIQAGASLVTSQEMIKRYREEAQ